MKRRPLEKFQDILRRNKKPLEEMTHEEKLEEQNELLRQNIRINTSPWALIYAGILRGLGAAIGATIVVSLLIALLRPLAQIGVIEPIANEIIQQLDNR